jgi:hypothetical protein
MKDDLRTSRIVSWISGMAVSVTLALQAVSAAHLEEQGWSGTALKKIQVFRPVY